VSEHEPDAVRLAGPELGAVALAAAASMSSGLPFLIVRKAAKEYGTANRLEGVFEPGERVCLVEDVVTSGGAVVEALDAVREAGLECRIAVCVLDREEGGADALARRGARLVPLFRAGELLSTEKTAAKRMVEPKRLGCSQANRQRQRRMHVTKQEFVDRSRTRQGSKRDAAEAVDAFLTDYRCPALGRRSVIHGIREVHDPGARRAPGRQPEESDGASTDPGYDRPQVLGRQPAEAGCEERCGNGRYVALRQHRKFREGLLRRPFSFLPGRSLLSLR
jgi:orotate phosphoribosyltransferase